MRHRVPRLIVAAWTLAASAGVVGLDGRQIEREHWVTALEVSGVPSEILYAVALVESGTSFDGQRSYVPWPWALNISHASNFYATQEAARLALQAEILQGNRDVAVGMWQIHLRYNGHFVEDARDLLQPVVNLYVAALVLHDCGRRHDDLRGVLSCYHSGDADAAGLAYADRVLDYARRWAGDYRLDTPSLASLGVSEPARPLDDSRRIEPRRMIVTEAP